MTEYFDPRRVFLLNNTVQDYAWGSPSAIPDLLGVPNPDGRPQAELWMGAHPKAPSRVDANGHSLALDELLDSYAEPILGPAVIERFGPRLPFLFKVLAAARALSIQAHPNLEQAEEGYRRETEEGIGLDAPQRNYRDSNHKPEVLCALGPFWALRGFRPVDEIRRDLAGFDIPLFGELASHFTDSKAAVGFPGFLRQLLELAPDSARVMVESAVEQSRQKRGDRYRWIERLAAQYPGDVGAMAPLFLNLIHLEAGEAIYQAAGQLHAYLEGTGVELMANSDNVLRGGLTRKHIDVPELLRVLSIEGGDGTGVPRSEDEDGARIYETPNKEFRLSLIDATHRGGFTARSARSVEILLCVKGKGMLDWSGGTGGRQSLARGQSFLIPSGVESYRIVGDAQLYRADVPLVHAEE